MVNIGLQAMKKKLLATNFQSGESSIKEYFVCCSFRGMAKKIWWNDRFCIKLFNKVVWKWWLYNYVTVSYENGRIFQPGESSVKSFLLFAYPFVRLDVTFVVDWDGVKNFVYIYINIGYKSLHICLSIFVSKYQRIGKGICQYCPSANAEPLLGWTVNTLYTILCQKCQPKRYVHFVSEHTHRNSNIVRNTNTVHNRRL